MRTRSLAIVALLLSPIALGAQRPDSARAAQCPRCAEWNAPHAPMRLHGNSWYVGTAGLSAVLITSKAGHVLIDGALPESAPQIVANIRALGFLVEDVRLIVNSHSHFDHAGGIAEIHRASGARVAATASSAAVMRRGTAGRDDPQFGGALAYPAVDVVSEFADGETLRVGPIAVTAHVTAGHTPGGTSWTWRSCDDSGRCLDFVYADSQTPISSDDFLFTRSTTYPTALADFARGQAVLESLSCDVLITPHPAASDLWERVRAGTLVDRDACRRYSATARAAVARRVAREQGTSASPAATTQVAPPPPVPASNARVRSALDLIKADNAWTLRQQVSICEIPAPPFKEAARAREFKKRLEALGLTNVRIDTAGNVIGERRGTGGGPTVMLAGHLDTVFPEGTDVKVRKVGARLVAPGIGDDCRGLAVVLAVARALQRSSVQAPGTIYFVGDVGEEGPGNLRGVRNLFLHELKGKVDYFISVDGEGTNITSRGVGSNRYRVTYKGPGGHSYGAFGRVNPIHALGRAIAQIGELRTPTTPKTTFSVGVIRGGTSVNSIPFEASAEIDMRSESAEALASLDAEVRHILGAARDAENARWGGGSNGKAAVTLQIDTIGIRPASGSQTAASPIVATALAAGKALGLTSELEASSSDANLPMSMGIPAITIDGGGHGGDGHALTEWYEDTAKGYAGPQWALLLVTALAGVK